MPYLIKSIAGFSRLYLLNKDRYRGTKVSKSLYDDRMVAFSNSVFSSGRNGSNFLYDDRLVAFSKSVLSVGMCMPNHSVAAFCRIKRNSETAAGGPNIGVTEFYNFQIAHRIASRPNCILAGSKQRLSIFWSDGDL